METVKITIGDEIIDGEVVLYHGELMKIALPDTGKLRVGQYVTCAYGGKEFIVRAINVHQNNVYLFIPMTLVDLNDVRRKYPRIKTTMKAYMIDNLEDDKTGQHIPIVLNDISHKGAGFSITDEHLVPQVGRHYTMINMDLPLVAQIKIMNEVDTSGGKRYGCEFLLVSKENLHNLKSYILYKQIINKDIIVE